MLYMLCYDMIWYVWCRGSKLDDSRPTEEYGWSLVSGKWVYVSPDDGYSVIAMNNLGSTLWCGLRANSIPPYHIILRASR
jgi:CubicO group peptidase (beta-lactamase class C family)